MQGSVSRCREGHKEDERDRKEGAIHLTLHFATSNKGKFNEAKSKLAQLSLNHLDIVYPEVQASSLHEVVEYALEWFKGKVDKNVMIEDSGLFIDELKGYPGVYSSYVFKTVGCKGILKLMEGVKNRGAEFRACAGLLVNGRRTILYGTCKGRIAPELRGKGGFGFDPIF
ncbi:MAG: hypothetical protein KAI64_00755, partial [Thermoplasmata archaeon]|nr:hypothetical protein [Thermoplasmata archaeon]